MVLLMTCGHPLLFLNFIDYILTIANGHAHSAAISVCIAVLLHGNMVPL